MDDNLLRIYLQDHLAAATAGVELARRARGANRANAYGPELARLAAQIQEDRQTLVDVLRRLGAEADRLKVVAAWLGEKVGRLKTNGRLTSYSPLSRLLELEVLCVGVESKAALWRALAHVVAGDTRFAAVDFTALAERAERQRDDLETLRLRAAEDAFAPGE